MASPSRERIRDAERSRVAILSAAQRLFSARGYDGTSLGEIGAAAGLSRGAPTYFFGSKDKLYADALAAAFDTRQEATDRAFAPVRAWAEGQGDLESLRDALTSAAAGYMRYLQDYPAFVALIMREELDGGHRLSAVRRSSTAMEDAFRAVRGAGRGRGVGTFGVEQAVLLFVSLTFAPFSYRRTLLRSLGLDMSSAAGRRKQAGLAAEQLLHLICA